MRTYYYVIISTLQNIHCNIYSDLLAGDFLQYLQYSVIVFIVNNCKLYL